MVKGSAALFAALVALLLFAPPAQAQDFAVPITVGSKTYTLTVSVKDGAIQVTSKTPGVTVGAVRPVAATVAAATPAATLSPVLVPAVAGSDSDPQALMATAVTIEYDDLFRNNEQHVGKVVRYVGQVLEYGDQVCLLCDDPGHYLRVGVTPLGYGVYDDPIYVLYEGDQRFLEDDIVTIWGTVDGLKSYIAVLGNEVTIPRIKALDVVLGETSNPRLPGAPAANRSANLRSGPATTFDIVGSVDAGQALVISARNQDGSWFQLDSGAWIAGFLVDSAPAAADTPLAKDIPETAAPAVEASAPAAAPAPEAAAPESTASEPAASGNSSIVSIGQEIVGGGWSFKVAEVHKRKTVYLYDNSFVAMGHFLIVIVEATNLQSGTDYFDRNIDPWITDDPGNVYAPSGSASSRAQWQYGGLTSPYENINPGNFARIAIAYDLPDATGRVLWSTDVGKWVDLGSFSALASEDN